VAAAHGVLRHLRKQGVVITHQQLGQGAALVEAIAQGLRFQAVAVTGALHHGAAHGALTGEHGNADHAFMADHGDFRGSAIFHDIQQRHDRCGWKIHVFQFAAILE